MLSETKLQNKKINYMKLLHTMVVVWKCLKANKMDTSMLRKKVYIWILVDMKN